MKPAATLYTGTVDGRIAETLARCRDRIPRAYSALIRSVDSTRAPAQLRDLLKARVAEVNIGRAGVVVSPEDLCRLVDRGFFCGFDEVWLFDEQRASVAEIPPGIFATSDGVSFADHVPHGLEEVMVAERCLLVLGDGCGLNYATWDRPLALAIQGMQGSEDAVPN